MLRKMKR